MVEILLLKNGDLLRRGYSMESIRPYYLDVSEKAVDYLFEDVGLAPDLTLEDVFKLLKRNPILFQVFARYSAEALTADAFREVSERERKSAEDVLYLFISRHPYRIGKGKSRYESSFDFQAFGYYEDSGGCESSSDDEDDQESERVLMDMGMAGTSPAPYMKHSLRYRNGDDTVWSGYVEECRGAPPVHHTLEFHGPILGELIRTILFEFTWFGVGAAREENINAFAGHIENAEVVPIDLESPDGIVI